MKIEVITRSVEKTKKMDYEEAIQVKVNHVKAFTVKDGGEPEDNRLSRDLSFVYEIPELLKDVFEAGKRGEELEFIENESEEL